MSHGHDPWPMARCLCPWPWPTGHCHMGHGPWAMGQGWWGWRVVGRVVVAEGITGPPREIQGSQTSHGIHHPKHLRCCTGVTIPCDSCTCESLGCMGDGAGMGVGMGMGDGEWGWGMGSQTYQIGAGTIVFHNHRRFRVVVVTAMPSPKHTTH